jgi:hypothetical protein
LKQQLANKLEIAQSSYNVVQKTLSQISSFIKDSSTEQLNNKLKPTDDDWDESA